MWQSPDPILNDYLGSVGQQPSELPGMGGVYAPVNLNLYSYTGNNPVNLVDPDGRARGARRGVRGNPYNDPVINMQVRNLEAQIRKHNPNYRYQTIRPTSGPNSTYNQRDIDTLRAELNRYQNLNSGSQSKLALPAPTPPRQVFAYWSVSNYRYGGLTSGIQHIMYRHGPNSGFTNVSKFSPGTRMKDISRYVDTALRRGVVYPNGNNGYKVIYNFGTPIGTNASGQTATRIEILIRNNVIRSAYPID